MALESFLAISPTIDAADYLFTIPVNSPAVNAQFAHDGTESLDDEIIDVSYADDPNDPDTVYHKYAEMNSDYPRITFEPGGKYKLEKRPGSASLGVRLIGYTSQTDTQI